MSKIFPFKIGIHLELIVFGCLIEWPHFGLIEIWRRIRIKIEIKIKTKKDEICCDGFKCNRKCT